MSNMFDYLKFYNNCDVIPMVEAIQKMFDFYRAKGLDMFKDAISLPGLAYKMLMNCPKANFSLFVKNEWDKSIFYFCPTLVFLEISEKPDFWPPFIRKWWLGQT